MREAVDAAIISTLDGSIAGVAHITATRALLALRDVARAFFCRGWALGTSGNFSVALSRAPLRVLISASGRDKRRLMRGDFVIVGPDGRATVAGSPPPSAETLLHVMLAQRPNIGAVLHTHSVWGTLLSDARFADGAVSIRGYEMLKGLAGVVTHDCEVRIPIFDNTQDIAALAREVGPALDATAYSPPAFLIRGHGLYAWGRDLDEARRHVEALEFLFEVVGRKSSPQPLIEP